jgi:hypothetical protein
MSEVVKYKLENFEAQPPARVWDAIASQLDEDHPQLREKLFAYSEEPPAETWNNISKKLDNPAPVLPIQKNRTRIFKYSMIATAVILTVIAITVLNNNRRKDDIAIETNPPVNGTGIPKDTTINQTAQVPDTGKGGIPDNQVAAIPSHPEKNARYLTVAHEDGTKVRLSKKVYPVINCAQQTASAISSKCKESIKALQEKMATSVNAASTDFGGLMDMLKDLEENR